MENAHVVLVGVSPDASAVEISAEVAKNENQKTTATSPKQPPSPEPDLAYYLPVKLLGLRPKYAIITSTHTYPCSKLVCSQ